MVGTTAYLATYFGQASIGRVAPYLGWVLFCLTTSLSITLICYIWRNHTHSLEIIKRQLRQFEQDNHIGIIMVDADNEAAGMVKAINRYLTHIKFHLEKDLRCQKEMKLQINAAETEKCQAEAVIHSIPEAVIVADQNNELLQANRVAQELFDFSLDLNSHMPIEQVIKDDDILALIQNARESQKKTLTCSLEHQDPITHKSLNLKIIASTVRNTQKDVIGVVLVVHDMTAEKEIARMKDGILSTVSHELKTPLASIRAYTEMLLDGESNSEETSHNFCKIILDQTLRLDQMIDDILNISKIESGRLRIKIEPTDLTSLIQKIEIVIKPQAQQKNIHIVIDTPKVPMVINADKEMIFQALLNLLSNAIKYSRPHSQITIALWPHGIDHISIEVYDQGVGIPEEALGHIFDKFYRVPGHQHMARGTGLGLNLVQQIIETIHQGEIQVESTPEKGSRFTVNLPIHSPNPDPSTINSDVTQQEITSLAL